MITSNYLVANLYPDVQTMEEIPPGSVTSNEADFIQCEFNPATGEVSRILVPSAPRPPADGGGQNQHSSAYALLLVYAKKETKSILKMVENYQIPFAGGNLETRIFLKCTQNSSFLYCAWN